MFLATVLYALIFAALLTLIFTLALGRRGPWSSWLLFFIVVFLAAWAAGLWIYPVGPVLAGVSWLPILAAAFMVALLLAAMAGPVRPPAERPPNEVPSEFERGRRPDGDGVDIFLWLLLALLAILIILGYTF